MGKLINKWWSFNASVGDGRPVDDKERSGFPVCLMAEFLFFSPFLRSLYVWMDGKIRNTERIEETWINMTHTKYEIVDVANPKLYLYLAWFHSHSVTSVSFSHSLALLCQCQCCGWSSLHGTTVLKKGQRCAPKFSIPQSLIVNSESASEVPKYHNFDTPCSEHCTCNSCFKFQFSFVKSCEITKFLILEPCKQSFFL
jgi:hypothetical protein